jgi:hypothetical protein
MRSSKERDPICCMNASFLAIDGCLAGKWARHRSETDHFRSSLVGLNWTKGNNDDGREVKG